MKKIFYSLLIAAATVGLTTSCSEDRDSNPTLNTQNLSLVLNTPGVSYNNTYDLQNSEYVQLTTSQPNYGYTAPTTYSLKVSLDKTKWLGLKTTYTTAKMDVSSSELNQAILDLVGEDNTDKLVDPQLLYVKAGAMLTGSDSIGWVESNVIQLPSVLAYVPKVEVTLPTTMYIVGDFAASYEGSESWKKFVPLHFAYSEEGFSYGIVYLANGNQFKVNPDDGWKGNDKGFGQVKIGDSNEASIVNAGSKATDNMKVDGESGWYTVVVKNKISGSDIAYELNTYKAKVYLFGATSPGSDQWSFDAGALFTMSGSADEPCVSPAMAASGEVRLAVDCGIDWWKTEFTIKNSDKSIYYRAENIASNWNDDKGADYSFQGEAGKQIVLDFTKGTGSMK